MARPLTARTFSWKERAEIRRAYWQLEELWRRRRWVWYFICRQFVMLGVVAKTAVLIGILSPALLAVIPLENLWYWRRFRRLSLRFPANAQLLQSLRDQGLDVKQVMKRFPCKTNSSR